MKVLDKHPFEAFIALEEDIKRCFPELDSTWAVNWLLNNREENIRKNIKIIALMNPEVMRVLKGAR